MTNFERIKNMSVSEYIEEFYETKTFPFFNYFDMEAYLNGENPDKLEYLKIKGKCKVTPPDIEVMSNVRSGASEEEKNRYIDSHIKEYDVLGKETVFGANYLVVADKKNMQITKIPERYAVYIKDYD